MMKLFSAVVLAGAGAVAAAGCQIFDPKPATVPSEDVLAKLEAVDRTTVPPPPPPPDVIEVKAPTLAAPRAPIDDYAFDDGAGDWTAAEKPSRTRSVATSQTKAPGGKKHKVAKGETLQKISMKYYGTTKKWPTIFEANRTTLKKPDLIVVGQMLVIP